LSKAKQVIIIGNGGIATELAYEIENCNVIWAVKDDHIGHYFFDAHSAKFFEKSIIEKEKKMKVNQSENQDNKIIFKKRQYTISSKL
jgi:hypothetical protein